MKIKNLSGEVLLDRPDLETLHKANLYGANLRNANLYMAVLSEANLRGANLRGAYLSEAYLSGANLRGADLSGANLGGQPIVVGSTRSDGYQFLLTAFPEEGVRIKAGCRDFALDSAKAHWGSAEYRDAPLGAESLRIVEHLEKLAALRGLLTHERKG